MHRLRKEREDLSVKKGGRKDEGREGMWEGDDWPAVCGKIQKRKEKTFNI